MYFGFDDVSVDYGKNHVLEHVSMEIPRGGIVTIIGKNGCGKSSLLKTVFRAVKPSSGRVLYNGRPVGEYGAREISRKIAYLPQIHFSPPDINVRTLVSYGRYPHMRFGKGLSQKDKEAIDMALDFTSLSDMAERGMMTLSGGERQRAWLAMSICQQPEILILDEPTTYLDISYQVEVLEVIKRLNRQSGVTIVMVLHDINLAARFSTYMYALKDRGIYAQGTPSEMVTHKLLSEVFDVCSRILRDSDNGCPFFIPLNHIQS
ncbi:MAG: ABC transporter ATP-binding protein [Sphaerochaeta sp.]